MDAAPDFPKAMLDDEIERPDDNEPTAAERLAPIVGRLGREADSRVGKRQSIEQRWLEDLRQYHGVASEEGPTKDPNIAARPTPGAAGKSTVQINLTRPKTNAFSARLGDLLFPTDDKNWGIRPTPVPELTEQAAEAVKQAERLRAEADAAEQAAMEQANATGQPVPMPAIVQKAQEAEETARRLQTEIDEAKKRCDRMAQEIEDQLVESRYPAEARQIIEDACKVGTGILEGPVVGDKQRARWVKGQDGQHILERDGDPKPRNRRVDYWSFFPDPNARTVEESEGFFIRYLYNKKQVRALAKLPGFQADAIRQLLKHAPRGQVPTFLTDLRNITGDHSTVDDARYTIWKYTGTLDCEDVRTIAEAIGDQGTLADLETEVDPLTEINVVVWFCDDQLLKFAIHPLDSGEPMYSVFCLEKDEASIFGYGIPYMMRHSARSFAAGWRMMLDNAGLSSGPQIVIDREAIEPQDGTWILRPRKIWQAVKGLVKDQLPFQTFDVPMHQAELAGIIALSKQHIDEETSLPQIAQGEQGTGVTRTAQGMALLMNSANVVFRRVVKHFDDDLTVPTIRRSYDWNMQFSKTEEIKGDFQVDARGSSVLLVREMQAQNLMILALQFGGSPIFGHMLKKPNMLRTLFNAHMLPAGEHVLDDETIEKVEAKMAEQAAAAAGAGGLTPQEEQLRRDELDAKVAIAEADRASRVELANIARETAMIQLAEKMNLTMDQTQAMLENDRLKRDHEREKQDKELGSKERILAAETAVAARTGEHAGGFV